MEGNKSFLFFTSPLNLAVYATLSTAMLLVRLLWGMFLSLSDI